MRVLVLVVAATASARALAYRARQCPCARVRALGSVRSCPCVVVPACSGLPKVGALDRRARRAGGVTRAIGV